VADNKPLLTLLSDREQAEQWAEDTACALGMRATRSRDVKAAVYDFALRNSVECRELTRIELFRRLATKLSFVHKDAKSQERSAPRSRGELREKNPQPSGPIEQARFALSNPNDRKMTPEARRILLGDAA
jgi:hypothetical protein